MNALKCSKAKAQHLSDTYDEMYSELIEFAEDTLRFAKVNGYVQGFFGLKLRAPSVNSNDQEVVSKAKRTITNMRVQSCAMLTVQAVMFFQDKIEELGLANDIRINATIHDSIYAIVRDDPKVIECVNKYLIEYMCHPYDGEIIPNSAELDIGTSWAWLSTIKKHSEDLGYSEGIKEAKEDISEKIKEYKENH